MDIQPIQFPLNLGTADRFLVRINLALELEKNTINYLLIDSNNVKKPLARGQFPLTQEQIDNHGNDINWAYDYAAEQLGVTLIK